MIINQSRLLVRRVKPSDIEALSIMLRSELLSFPFLPENARISESLNYSPESLAAACSLRSQILLVALQQEQIVGFIHANITYDVAWLLWVVVPVDQRRHNRVWYLWKKLFSELRSMGVHKIWGAIRSNNSVALDMAHAIGFSLMGTAPNFWHNCDYILVGRTLQSSSPKPL